MSSALTVTKSERRNARRDKTSDRALEYYKAGLETIKPIVSSKPFLAISGSIVLYKLERAGMIDGVSAGVFTGALLAWLTSDAIDSLLPF